VADLVADGEIVAFERGRHGLCAAAAPQGHQARAALQRSLDAEDEVRVDRACRNDLRRPVHPSG